MGVKFLLDLLESEAVPNAVVEVDLLKVAREFVKSIPPPAVAAQKKADSASASSKFCLVVDGECCLNRLYGGFLSDWVCGGQWNRMADFLDKLVSSAENANIELTVFFNGAIESQRMNEWIVQQKQEYEKINRVLAHVAKFGYPPGNKLWIAPVGLRMALRMMLRHKNVNVVFTIDDYRQEVIAYCRENNFHGIITDDAEYIAFDPPRLFSASKFKLKFKGTLESREFFISELMKELQLTNEKLCVLVALLGNYLLADQDLKDVYEKASIDLSSENTAEFVVRKLAKYLNDVNASEDLDEIVVEILGSDSDARGPTLKQSIQYYMDGTKDGFLKYRSVSSGKHGISSKNDDNDGGGDGNASNRDVTNDDDDDDVTEMKESADISQEPDLDTSKLASENTNGEKNLLNTYKEAQSCFATSAGLDNTTTTTDDYTDVSGNSSNVSASNYDTSSSSETSTIASESSKNTTTTTAAAAAAIKTTTKAKQEKLAPVLPPVPHEVMRTVSERHSKGLMSPYIYQILSQGEIKLPVILEDGKQIPNVYLFYKPVRQMVYAIVFNLHHHVYMASKNNTAVQVDIRIKEWIFDATARTHKAEYVKAAPVGWRVPTIQRLWFGTTQDDKRRRLRAFLTCMRSDVQLLLNPEFVPQQLLVAAVVLRYVMSFPDKKVLRKPELDAFIVAVLSPEFSLPNIVQDLKIPQLSSRGVQLAALFMKGVEMALLVNDACGAPIPWLMCCPWLFFDGRLFQFMFAKATSVKNLYELCDNRVALVMRAERMRQAVLEGLNVQFARPPLPSTLVSPGGGCEEFKSSPYPHQQQQHHHPHPHGRPSYMRQHRAGAVSSSSSSLSSTSSIAPSTGMAGSRPMSSMIGGGSGSGGMVPGHARRSLGGRLEIAGVVVGSWGPNYNLSQPLYESASATAGYLLPGAAQKTPPPPLHHHHHHHPQQVAAAGSYNNFTSNYGPRSGANNSRPKGKNFSLSFAKKKPIKKDKKMPGKGRGLGNVNSVADGMFSSSGSSSNGNSNSEGGNCNTNNAIVTDATTIITTTSSSTSRNVVTDSELSNGRIEATDSSQMDDQGSRCGASDDGYEVTNGDRFEDVIPNGDVGAGGDAKIAKTFRDASSTKSMVEAVSK